MAAGDQEHPSPVAAGQPGGASPVANGPASSAGPPGAQGTARPATGVVVPHRATWQAKLAAALICGMVRGLDATLRYDLRGPSGTLAAALKGPVIFSIWHNRLALSLMLYGRYIQRQAPARRLAAMVSASRDGALLARVLEHFRVAPVRGSTSRRGPQALREFVSWGERGYDLAITPDGPRGPCYVVQDGVVSLAQLTGLPILPVAYRLQWKYRPHSWDRFQVPVPGSACTVFLGELVRVPREASESDRAACRQLLQTRMREITVD